VAKGFFELFSLTRIAFLTGRSEWGQGGHNSPGAESLRGLPKSSNNVASTFFNAADLLPKGLIFEHGGAILASCPGRHLTSLRPWCLGLLAGLSYSFLSLLFCYTLSWVRWIQ